MKPRSPKSPATIWIGFDPQGEPLSLGFDQQDTWSELLFFFASRVHKRGHVELPGDETAAIKAGWRAIELKVQQRTAPEAL